MQAIIYVFAMHASLHVPVPVRPKNCPKLVDRWGSVSAVVQLHRTGHVANDGMWLNTSAGLQLSAIPPCTYGPAEACP